MSRKNKDKMVLGELRIKIVFAVIALLCLIVLGLLGAATWMQFASGSLMHLQTQVQSVKKTSEDLESLIVVTQTLLNSSSSDVGKAISADQLKSTHDLAEKKRAELESEKGELKKTLDDIGTPAHKEAGNNAVSLINKQLLLINRFEDAYEYSLPYVELRANLLSALDKLVQADSSDKKASAQLVAGNADDANKASETANAAKASALEAKTMFEQAKGINTEASVQLISSEVLDEYVTYCQLIADAQDATIASANAYVSRNKDELSAQNDAYNKTKEKASAISSGWEKSASELLTDAFVEERSDEACGFNQDLKERDSLFNLVSNYLKGNE